MKKTGFVSISGQPNVGKSTLLNGLLGEKVAIISEKPETTRDTIRGILTRDDCQIIFMDTPGIHKPHDLLGRIMLTRARSSLLEADIILLLTEKRTALNREDLNIISGLPRPKGGQTVLLIINKADRVKEKKTLLPLMDRAKQLYPFDEIIPMCALDRSDLDMLLNIIKPYLKEGPFLYPEEQLTDKNEHFLVQEIIREKILAETYEEIPHSVAVVVDKMKKKGTAGVIEIYATIFVERTSQKSIIIGKKGAMLKQIGKQARLDIEKLLSGHVYLDLWVKVREKWKKDANALEEIGYST
ncbi:MAG: GTPase Era [Candidatus Omnitrophica bacterium]|nr:GTPase Era [Candidatus Omnitrophota bacterium]